MKQKAFPTAVVLALLLLATGCATHTTASGGRGATVLAGVVTVSTNSFQPPPPATLDVDTSKIVSAGNPTGKKVTLFWGLITLHDY